MGSQLPAQLAVTRSQFSPASNSRRPPAVESHEAHMKPCAILALALTAPLGAQVTSQQRIPVRKQRPVHVDTVLLRQVDTVMVVRNDTVYVAAPPPTSLAAFDTTIKSDSSCRRGWLPIPIPIPIPFKHHEPTPETPTTPTTPTLPSSTTPEPATIWLVGAGLSALGLAGGRARKRRRESDNKASKNQGGPSPV